MKIFEEFTKQQIQDAESKHEELKKQLGELDSWQNNMGDSIAWKTYSHPDNPDGDIVFSMQISLQCDYAELTFYYNVRVGWHRTLNSENPKLENFTTEKSKLEQEIIMNSEQAVAMADKFANKWNEIGRTQHSELLKVQARIDELNSVMLQALTSEDEDLYKQTDKKLMDLRTKIYKLS